MPLTNRVLRICRRHLGNLPRLFCSPRTLLSIAGALLISVYFLGLVWPSLAVYFVPDDMMNLYRAWDKPALTLVKANVLFFWPSPFYRPFVSVWYRLVFDFAGFNPFPFHATLLVVFLVNLFLTYATYRRLSGSREVAAVATLLGSYYRRINWLYFDTSFAYDVWCYTFYFSAFLLYVRIRQQNRLPRLWELIACSVLYICALNSKEMAVTLPVFLLIYELLYHPIPLAHVRRWPLREGRGVLVIGLLTLAFVAGRWMGPDSLAAMDGYRPVFTWARFMETSGHFLGDLSGVSHDWNSPAVLACWGSLLAIAFFCRQKVLWFAWLFLMLSPLPVAFVPARTANHYYIPWFGWILYLGALLMEAVVFLTRKLKVDPAQAARYRGPALVVSLALVLFPIFHRKGWTNAADARFEAPIIRSTAEQIYDLYPRLPHASRLLFLDDPLKPDRYDLLELVRLVNRDTTLIVDRAKTMSTRPDEKQLASYDHVFDYQGGVFVELKRPWKLPPLAMVVRSPERAEVYHENWEAVTVTSPARQGEVLISQAIGLGATIPPVPEGQPFPPEPLLPVSTEVSVYVDGKPAEVTLKIGWPGKVNQYRVDFCVPEGTPRGMATLRIRAGDLTGPVARMPVR